MIALAAVVAKDVVSIDDFIKYIVFQPCFLDEVNVKLFEFHGGDEVFISGVVVWLIRSEFSVGVAGAAAESMCILGDYFACVCLILRLQGVVF